MPCLQALGRGMSQEKVAVQAGCGLPSVLKDWWRPAGPTDCSKHTLLGFYELHRRWDLNTDPQEKTRFLPEDTHSHPRSAHPPAPRLPCDQDRMGAPMA